MSNYPPGAEHDPRAPYNQKDDELTEWCPSGVKGCCVCCNEVMILDYEDTCEDCFVPQEIEEDDGSDDAYDRWKDSQLEGD